MLTVPECPFKLIFQSSLRPLYVLEKNLFDEEEGQTTYSVVGLRPWTLNGETLAEDVLLTLITGAVQILPVRKGTLENEQSNTKN